MNLVPNHNRLLKIGLPIVLITSLLVNLGVVIYVLKATRTVNQETTRSRNEMKNFRDEMKSFRDEMIASVLAEKTEQLTKDAKTDQDKTIAVARWVSANISNREPLGGDEFGWFAYRSGQCGAKAAIFVKMLSYINLPAKIFNMYNFGEKGIGGHSNAQVFYDGSWHYIDLTYAGCFINDEGIVMGWDEMVKDPDYAIQHMVIFEDTNDRDGDLEQDPSTRKRFSNVARMTKGYTSEILRSAKSAGFWRDGKVKVLYPEIDAKKLPQHPIQIGEIDSSLKDVNERGVTLVFSQYLGGLGTYDDNLEVQWDFVNCVPGQEYYIDYAIFRATHEGLRYWVNVDGAELLEGGEQGTSLADVNGNRRVWRIKFKALAERSSVYIGYDHRELGKYLSVDQISIGAINP